jgi:hypothetical protein
MCEDRGREESDFKAGNNLRDVLGQNEYLEYKELYYKIFVDKKIMYSASAYGIPEIHTEKCSHYNSCKKSIHSQIDKYIIESKIKLLNYARPIPDKIDVTNETMKLSSAYELRSTTTIFFYNAIKKFNEKTLESLNDKYENLTPYIIDRLLQHEHLFDYNYGDVIKKILNGTNLYITESGIQFCLENFFSSIESDNSQCILIPYKNNWKISCDQNVEHIRHFSNSSTKIYKLVFDASEISESTYLKLFLSIDNEIKDEAYLHIFKINYSTFSYKIEGSDNLSTNHNTFNLCAPAQYFKKLSSLIPKSLVDLQSQNFEIFNFELAKFINFSLFINFNDQDIHDYLEKNLFLKKNLHKLSFKKDEFDDASPDLINPCQNPQQNIRSTLYLLNKKNDISNKEFDALRDALIHQKELELDDETIKKCTIYCWRYIKLLPGYEIYAKIVLLKIEKGLSDIKIFNCLFEDNKKFSVLKESLHIREDRPEDIINKANIINYRYKDIYKIANEFNLPHPKLKKSKNNN